MNGATTCAVGGTCNSLTTAITNAGLAATAASPVTVQIPAGVYSVSASLTISANVIIQGAGVPTSRLQFIITASVGHPCITLSSGSTFRDIQVEAYNRATLQNYSCFALQQSQTTTAGPNLIENVACYMNTTAAGYTSSMFGILSGTSLNTPSETTWISLKNVKIYASNPSGGVSTAIALSTPTTGSYTVKMESVILSANFPLSVGSSVTAYLYGGSSNILTSTTNGGTVISNAGTVFLSRGVAWNGVYATTRPADLPQATDSLTSTIVYNPTHNPGGVGACGIGYGVCGTVSQTIAALGVSTGIELQLYGTSFLTSSTITWPSGTTVKGMTGDALAGTGITIGWTTSQTSPSNLFDVSAGNIAFVNVAIQVTTATSASAGFYTMFLLNSAGNSVQANLCTLSAISGGAGANAGVIIALFYTNTGTTVATSLQPLTAYCSISLTSNTNQRAVAFYLDTSSANTLFVADTDIYSASGTSSSALVALGTTGSPAVTFLRGTIDTPSCTQPIQMGGIATLTIIGTSFTLATRASMTVTSYIKFESPPLFTMPVNAGASAPTTSPAWITDGVFVTSADQAEVLLPGLAVICTEFTVKVGVGGLSGTTTVAPSLNGAAVSGTWGSFGAGVTGTFTNSVNAFKAAAGATIGVRTASSAGALSQATHIGALLECF